MLIKTIFVMAFISSEYATASQPPTGESRHFCGIQATTLARIGITFPPATERRRGSLSLRDSRGRGEQLFHSAKSPLGIRQIHKEGPPIPCAQSAARSPMTRRVRNERALLSRVSYLTKPGRSEIP